MYRLVRVAHSGTVRACAGLVSCRCSDRPDDGAWSRPPVGLRPHQGDRPDPSIRKASPEHDRSVGGELQPNLHIVVGKRCGNAGVAVQGFHSLMPGYQGQRHAALHASGLAEGRPGQRPGILGRPPSWRGHPSCPGHFDGVEPRVQRQNRSPRPWGAPAARRRFAIVQRYVLRAPIANIVISKHPV